MGGLFRFPGNGPDDQDRERLRCRRTKLATGVEFDQDLDRQCRKEWKDDALREDSRCGNGPHAFLHVLRLLRHRPEELLVFCTTLNGQEERHVPWGDIYGLTDPPDTYRYLFTLYTRGYVQECRRRRGEVIQASAEDVILSVAGLTPTDVRRGVVKWVNRYYPPLKGLPIRLEDPEAVEEMISTTYGQEE